MYLGYLGFTNAAHLLEEQIWTLQIFEWLSLIYIHTSQKSRRIEEILWDHNNENMTVNLLNTYSIHRIWANSEKRRRMDKSNNYRKLEIVMKRVFLKYFVIYSIFQGSVYTIEIIDNNAWQILPELIFLINDILVAFWNFSVLTLTFVATFYITYNFHFYEFRHGKWYYISFYLIVVTTLIVKTYATVCLYLSNEKPQLVQDNNLLFVFSALHVLAVPQMILVYSLVFIKEARDSI